MLKSEIATKEELVPLLDQLIEALASNGAISENKQAISFQEKFSIWRGLINQTAPSEITADYLMLESAFLTKYFTKEVIATLTDCQLTNYPNILLYHGDITHLAVDAIVNAANSDMLGCFIPNHHCIDNAIHTFAGAQLRLECQQIMQEQGHKEAIGRAKVTLGYHLPAKYIIHTVGPQMRANQPVSSIKRDLLKKSYQACLDTAYQQHITTLAFCSISTGVFGFPKELAAKIAVTTVIEWLKNHPTSLQIVFVTFTKKDQDLYQQLLKGDINE
ncbi:O-acetyl-ADP-ribose deacetylase (regulator of RNase III), contains Macro domain [Granulicatella balaenopterae]|uniref:O-acetyl-ADP-ribose deacetylase (Regulator of RNase III), contains Macro domain n=1 Tax=Granulicatella balaenopterae TaxID=137733 RepID=A0A1H9GX73_9LACT|nr:protein-ADP-ribose hydrolase [Granulicatella balaenopterae]SEQ54644.1 O-acetyl-ADP-ribose deacetylase (regulator of RNase III), contains Macro domain [Granulicatella balaenopterae]